MKLSIAWLLLVATFLQAGHTYRILGVFPTPGKSHTILGEGVVRHLTSAGHDVTYITPILMKSPPKNLRQIDVSANFKYLTSHGDVMNIKSHMEQKKEVDMSNMRVIIEMMLDVHNLTYHNPNVQRLLSDTSEQFDVVIAEWMFTELHAAISAIFNAPHIWLSTVEPHWLVLRLLDEASSPAYTADILSSNIPPLPFLVRIQELWSRIYTLGLKKFVLDSSEENIYSTLTPYFKMRGREAPPFNELVFNASLMFGNSHVSLGQAMTLPQSLKPIGGYHIDTRTAPLPQDLQTLMDNAKHGVIYFSLGSNIKSKDLPDETKQGLLKMFGKLNHIVIWKFEEALSGLPSNVHILQWAPQPSILAHPNCILFITHGGLLSTTETIHFGKPIIGIPVFGDQFVNVNRAVAKGFAKRVDLSYDMADELEAAIKDIIQDPKYSNKVKELSLVYHDRPVPPGKELVHWVEHVVKTKGAPHLRSPALSVPLYQKMYLDLIALVVVVLLVIKAVFRRIFKKKPSKEKKQ
ncbi:UDP-glucuronosyltransferase 2B2-like [Ostrinia furnacalis]|uniref:UDP-glucuronosyltransferase 2B2-like n=1 Tax=Ostrinia furnacalis TaxID=93504 RepID=UPI00103F6A28|nr:UDP-glucuronosyltransferase 2B2-like [Ostrinia furnacalis]